MADDQLKFIYWFAYYKIGFPSVRYRAKYPLMFYQKNYGLKYYLINPGYKFSNIIKFLKAYFSALLFRKKDSLIIIQKVNSDFIYAWLLKLLVKLQPNSIYDLDDADYLEHSPKTIYYFIKNCSAVSVGSHEMLIRLGSRNPKIYLNTSPTQDLNIVKNKRNELFTIGWIGGFGGEHRKSLIKFLFPALYDLPFKITLTFLGVNKAESIFLHRLFNPYKHIHLNIPSGINWMDEENIQYKISTFDIGIATLMDTEFHRSKSAYKVKQYLNNGVPVLSTNLPENNYFIKDGINGYLCSTSNDFKRRILEIQNMSDEDYKLLSLNARNSISQFDLIHYCKNLSYMFKDLKQSQKLKTIMIPSLQGAK